MKSKKLLFTRSNVAHSHHHVRHVITEEGSVVGIIWKTQFWSRYLVALTSYVSTFGRWLYYRRGLPPRRKLTCLLGETRSNLLFHHFAGCIHTSIHVCNLMCVVNRFFFFSDHSFMTATATKVKKGTIINSTNSYIVLNTVFMHVI